MTALRALSPGVTLNLLGFDVGAELSVTAVDNGDAWKSAGGGSTQVVMPRVSIHKGLIAGLDVGLSAGAPIGGGTATLGGILRYQLMEPSVIAPGVTMRLSASRGIGNASIEVKSLGADLVVAKPLLLITPYAGVGTVRTQTRAPNTSLVDVTTNSTRTFFGFDSRLAFATLSAEAERIGRSTTVSSKIGFRF